MLKISVLSLLMVPILCSAQNTTMPDGPGKAIIQKSCTACHALSVVTSKRATHDEWASLVDQMVSRGANVSDNDVETVVQYLATHYGPAKEAGTGQVAPSKPAPANGKTTSAQ